MMQTPIVGNETDISISEFFNANGIARRIDSNENYFELLGLSGVSASQEELKAAFVQLAFYFDPERYARRPQDEQELAQHNYTIISRAYDTLRDIPSRTAYLVEIAQGVAGLAPPAREIPEDVKDIAEAFVLWHKGDRGETTMKTVSQAKARISRYRLDQNQRLLELLKRYDLEDNDHRETIAALWNEVDASQSLERLAKDDAIATT